LDQVTFQVPPGIQGCYVPVAVEANGVVGGSSTIAVSTSGQTCSDSILGTDLIGKLAAGGTVDFGFAQLFALDLLEDSYLGSVVPDYVSTTFSEFTPQSAGLASYGVSQGYCITGTNNPDTSPAQLDAGANITLKSLQTLTQGPATITAFQQSGGDYFAPFYLGISPFDMTYFNYAVSGAGGNKVGAFSVIDRTWGAAVQFSGIVGSQTLPRFRRSHSHLDGRSRGIGEQPGGHRRGFLADSEPEHRRVFYVYGSAFRANVHKFPSGCFPRCRRVEPAWLIVALPPQTIRWAISGSVSRTTP
jgi:hypothetical protein